MKLVNKFIGFQIPGLGIFLLLLILYLLGVLTSNFLGKQFFNLIEKITIRIPFVKTVYQIGKQLVFALSFPERQVFKRVVMVNYIKPTAWTLGFVTGSLVDNLDPSETLLKVFIPTPPNPASGTMIIVRESETRDPGWTVEEGIKAVISGGIISPPSIN